MPRPAVFHLMLAVLAMALVQAPPVLAKGATGAPDILTVYGNVANVHEKGVNGAAVTFFVNGKPAALPAEVTTSSEGTFEARLTLPPGTLPGARVDVSVERSSYKPTGRQRISRIFSDTIDQAGSHHYLGQASFTLERAASPALWIATAVLLAVYVLIAFELMHRTLAALFGASMMLFVSYSLGTFDHAFRILTFDDAMRAIDGNVIFLLMAMMIIVGIMKKTGVFQWMAYRAFRLARGNIYALAAILMFVTAVVSAFLDNVTTMLLIIPVTVEIALALKIGPIALLLPEVFASNVGGTATLIGDPPNILIGSYAKLTFLDFLGHLTTVNAIGLAVSTLFFVLWFRKDYHAAKVEDVPAMTARLRDEYRITDHRLLAKSLVILAITVTLFVFHGKLEMEPSIAAMVGAALLLITSGVHIVEMLEKEIEWPTLIFFMMLFVVVAGAEQTGLIQVIADWVREMSHGSLVVAIVMVLWVSALLSAIIDNIPFTATMLPIVAYLTTAIPGAQDGILWWALALGACLGGNGTLIGASANVVTAGMAEKAGHPISFMQYLKIAFLPMLITVTIAMLWLLFVQR